jgi:hypothetical protein
LIAVDINDLTSGEQIDDGADALFSWRKTKESQVWPRQIFHQTTHHFFAMEPK